MKYGRLKKSIFSKSLRDIKNEGIKYFIVKTNRFFYQKYLNKNAVKITEKLKNKPKDYFMFNDEKLEYLIHPYNLSWTNERAAEIPIILNYIKKTKAKIILEFGAVLPHYLKSNWEVLDKFETGVGILNQDIVDFKTKEKYELIISISTLEHVGFDDENKHEKIIEAINIIKNSLKKHGKFIATMPLGYNKFMDNLIFSEKIGFDKMYFLKRINRKNKWKQVAMDDVRNARYNYPYNNANAIFIGIFEK